ncbi:MAG: 16S rRNA (guanine(966)-N(2))-methyltransferase RsmD [Candidatus Omnitrophica bacterium]|nr:16S rRNA (guanine(966)-N(2))-methyltransferase RsmD [Candidatus Omnitrophota bacterium]
MRIIGGGLKGRKLDFIKSPDIRPTMDKVRQALFNVIASAIPGTSVLDLYAGSGAFGLEAISRGARSATFIDNNHRCIEIIKKNIEHVGVGDRATVMKMDVLRALDLLGRPESPHFDIVIMDPPYYKDLAKKTLIKLGLYDIVSPNNIIIIEHYRKDEVPDALDNLKRCAEKRYGDTLLSFYKKEIITVS